MTKVDPNGISMISVRDPAASPRIVLMTDADGGDDTYVLDAKKNQIKNPFNR